ncbi:hypothetical protein HU200_016645 [Digitaria exilis]|uniref:Uncharacterized protein n=1 Tax=Digitaria exilis TaxID=1010633 RepID=A0A835KKL4_9POAL|nr:hypothetical protein HU200_016645 [Digitaria exilis]
MDQVISEKREFHYNKLLLIGCELWPSCHHELEPFVSICCWICDSVLYTDIL